MPPKLAAPSDAESRYSPIISDYAGLKQSAGKLMNFEGGKDVSGARQQVQSIQEFCKKNGLAAAGRIADNVMVNLDSWNDGKFSQTRYFMQLLDISVLISDAGRYKNIPKITALLKELSQNDLFASSQLALLRQIKPDTPAYKATAILNQLKSNHEEYSNAICEMKERVRGIGVSEHFLNNYDLLTPGGFMATGYVHQEICQKKEGSESTILDAYAPKNELSSLPQDLIKSTIYYYETVVASCDAALKGSKVLSMRAWDENIFKQDMAKYNAANPGSPVFSDASVHNALESLKANEQAFMASKTGETYVIRVSFAPAKDAAGTHAVRVYDIYQQATDPDVVKLYTNLRGKAQGKIGEMKKLLSDPSQENNEKALYSLLNFRDRNYAPAMQKISEEKRWLAGYAEASTLLGKSGVFLERHSATAELFLAMGLSALYPPAGALYFAAMGGRGVMEGVRAEDPGQIIFGLAMMAGFSGSKYLSQISHASINASVGIATIGIIQGGAGTAFTTSDWAEIGTNAYFLAGYAKVLRSMRAEPQMLPDQGFGQAKTKAWAEKEPTLQEKAQEAHVADKAAEKTGTRSKAQKLTSGAEPNEISPESKMRGPQQAPLGTHDALAKEAAEASGKGDYVLSAIKYLQAAESATSELRDGLRKRGIAELEKLAQGLEAAGPGKAFKGLIDAKNELGNSLDAVPKDAAEFLAGRIGKMAREYYRENGGTPQGQAKAARMMQEASGYYPDVKSGDRMALLANAAEIFGRNKLHEEEARCCFEIGTPEAREKGRDACDKWKGVLMETPGIKDKVDAVAKFYAEMANISGASDTRALLYKMASYTYARAGRMPDAFAMFGNAISADPGIIYSDVQKVTAAFDKMYTYRQGIDFDLEGPKKKYAAKEGGFYAQELLIGDGSKRLGEEAWCFLHAKRAGLRAGEDTRSKSAFEGALDLIPKGKRLEFIEALLTQMPSWEEKDLTGEAYIAKTLFRMQALEGAVPGGVEKLYLEYGIRHFSRYTLNELVELCGKTDAGSPKQFASMSRQMLEKRENTALVGREEIILPEKVLADALRLENKHAMNFEADNGKVYTVERAGNWLKVYQAVYLVSMPCEDHNGAFNQQQVVSKEIEGKFDVVRVEAGSKKELARKVISVSGKRGKISAYSWGGHGYYEMADGKASATVVLRAGEDGKVRLSDFMQGGVVAQTSSGKLSAGKDVMLPGKDMLDARALLAFSEDPSATQAVFESSKGKRYIAEKGTDGGIAIRKEGYLTKYFTDNVSVIMLSCSQGAPGAFAQSGSIRFPGVDFQGPTKPTSLVGLEYGGIAQGGKVILRPKWRDTENKTYNAGADVSGQQSARKGSTGQEMPAGKSKVTLGADYAAGQKPEAGFASVGEIYRAMNDAGYGELFISEGRIGNIPKSELGRVVTLMKHYEGRYPDLEIMIRGKPVYDKGIAGINGSYKVWEAAEGGNFADFMEMLEATKLPHQLSCRSSYMSMAMLENFGTDYAFGKSSIRFAGTASVFEVPCADGRHLIAKVDDVSQEMFAHKMHRMFGIDPGYSIGGNSLVGVMEIVDGMTLYNFKQSNGMPGLALEQLMPGANGSPRIEFLGSIMESSARQLMFRMDDTHAGNYMVLPSGKAVRIDFMDFAYQNAEGIHLLDVRTDNTIGFGKDAAESALMKGAFMKEWQRMQEYFPQNKEAVRAAYLGNDWNGIAASMAEKNFGFDGKRAEVGAHMFSMLEENMRLTPEQAWQVFSTKPEVKR